MALAPVKTFQKDPNAVLDYGLDWAKWLGDDTIATSTWTVPAGITKASDASAAAITLIWLSGGTAGTSYACVNRITTVGGRTDDRSIQINVAER